MINTHAFKFIIVRLETKVMGPTPHTYVKTHLLLNTFINFPSAYPNEPASKCLILFLAVPKFFHIYKVGHGLGPVV